MQSSKEAQKEANENQHRQQISYISLVALSQHKGVFVSADLTSKKDAPSSFIALNTLNGDESRRQSASAFAAADELCAGGRKLYAPTKSVLRLNQSSSFHHFHSSIVSPSVFHLIPELQRGQSSYNIDQSDSSSFSATSEWYTNFGDIDYLWAVVPTAQSLTESVKAVVLDSYTDSSLPTILQPRFKPKTPGTALALWLPNIMASLAKRLTEENPSEIAPVLPAGGDKNKDIVKQNISLLLKKDFITSNWPFKGNKQSDDLPDQSHVSQQLQKNRRKNGGITIHRTKVKHLRGGDSDHKLDSDNSSLSQQGSATMDKKLSWRAPWNKSTRIKYVEANRKDERIQDNINHDNHGETENHEDVKLENYDTTPVMSRRRARSQGSQDIDSERSSSAELPMSPDSPVFLDADDSMVFFNYNDDGTSYTCTLSPIQRTLSNPQLDNASERTYSTYSSCSGETSSMLTPVIPASSIGSITSIDSEDEVELYEESFRLETEHINCECIKYSRDDHDDFPYMKTLEDDTIDTENKGSQNMDIDSERSSSADHHAHDVESSNENCTLKRGGSKGKSKFKLKRVPSSHSSRQRRITDTGRLPPNSHKEDGAADPQQVKSEKDMRDKIEYIRVASQEDAKISAKLYIRIPEKVNLCKIQTHLLLCAMRAFFTCTEGIQVRWVKSFHDKIYQLLQRSDTKIKFSCPNVMESDSTVCLLLSHDASILLRDRQSKLLVTIADILQIMTDNLMVLELNKKTNQSPPKKSKSKTMKLLDSESMICYDTQTEWFLPVFL